METYTTSQVAKLADVNLDTVLYYEKRGLLPKPNRTSSGYRQYEAEHVAHIRFIRRAQNLGFSLEEIRELLDMRAEPDAADEIRKITAQKVREIDAKIHDLQRIREKLVELSAACGHSKASNHCVVLDALEDFVGAA